MPDADKPPWRWAHVRQPAWCRRQTSRSRSAMRANSGATLFPARLSFRQKAFGQGLSLWIAARLALRNEPERHIDGFLLPERRGIAPMPKQPGLAFAEIAARKVVAAAGRPILPPCLCDVLVDCLRGAVQGSVDVPERSVARLGTVGHSSGDLFPIVGWGFLGLGISPKLIPAALVPHLLFAAFLWGLCRVFFGGTMRTPSCQPTGGRVVITTSIVTCPRCGHQTSETMPIDACVIAYDCPSCGAHLKPKGKEVLRPLLIRLGPIPPSNWMRCAAQLADRCRSALAGGDRVAVSRPGPRPAEPPLPARDHAAKQPRLRGGA